ncbi:MAG: SPOR domain-containing protein [Treponema sp.]|jgi:hypothetical protein|nr:SPOR domain-containing protein [Treponema sp.]
MKIKTIVLLTAALILLCGSSPWEGAAATAPDGELPGNGRYVATNSFPRNTVVDITNIETGKSTRAIVANGLNSPGLLALVSREAAELIGMRTGSVGRIRMTQPSDPIAYLRFKEGIASGITDYDSGNIITEETFRGETAGQESAQENTSQPVQEQPQLAENTASEEQPANAQQTASGYLLEPEWGGRSTNVVNLPEYIVTEVITEEIPEEEAQPEEIAEEPPEEAHPEEIAEEPPEEETQPEEIAEEAPEEAQPEEIAEEAPEEAQPEEIAEEIPEEAQPEEIAEEAPEEAQPEEIAEEVPEEEPQEIAEATEYNIVPAEERPPVSDIYGIDPASIIPGISGPPAEPIEEIVELPAAEEPVIAVIESPAELSFSIPRVTELDIGKYYVQIAALDSAESVENAVRLIDTSYKPVVYKDGDKWFRILLGPLNQGESAAVLVRFKSIGFKDAFVRQVR